MPASTLLPRRVLGAIGLTLALTAPLSARQDAPRQPVFRAGTELIAIDVSVVDDRGDPVPTLRPDEFTVSVDGAPRAVVTAEFIRQGPAPGAPPAADDPRFSTNEAAAGGRLLLLVFDGGSLTPGIVHDVQRAASDFLDALGPADRVGLLAFPGRIGVEFTADHAQIRDALSRVRARGIQPAEYRLGLAEAYAIDRGDDFALRQAILRECRGEDGQWGVLCVQMLRNEARLMTVEGEQRATVALRTLRTILDELEKISAPKTVIWITQGMPLDSSRSEFGGLSAAAAAARTTIHAVHLDRTHIVDVTRRTPAPNLMADRRLELDGLEVITSVSRGTVFSTSGTGADAFAALARRMTGYYLLSIEATEADRDGAAHEISVSVARPGLEVRARRTFTAPPAAEAVPVESQVTALLGSPIIATELPLKVATHNLRDPGDPDVRVVVSSEIGRSFTNPVRAAVGYVVRGADGAVAATSYQERTLMPQEPGGAPLQAVGMLSVPPGRYVLRLAVVDQDGRPGSVEHHFEAAVDSMGAMEVADLLLFAADSDGRGELHPAIDTRLRPSPYEAYLEIYPRDLPMVPSGVVVEVAGHADGPALTSAPGRVEMAEGPRWIARGVLPLAPLPPGTYVARIVVSGEGVTARQTRPIRVDGSIGQDLELRRILAATGGEFEPHDVLVHELLRPALAGARVLDSAQADPETADAAAALEAGDLTALEGHERFGPASSPLAGLLHGLALYRMGSHQEATATLDALVERSPAFWPARFYLGACHAASGRHGQAVAAWRRAAPIYGSAPAASRLLADGLLRLGELALAVRTLETAAARWPDDPVLRRRVARTRAMTGAPPETVIGLLDWLSRHPDDDAIARLALRLAMADLAGAGAGSPEAFARLRELVALRRRTGQAPSPLAARWLEHLDGRRLSR